MPVTVDDVIEALRPVEDPELHRSIVDLDMVRDVRIDGDAVALEVTLTVAGCPLRNEIQSRVTGAVTALDGVAAVDVDLGVMTDEERAALRQKLHGDPAATAGSQPAHGHAEGRAIPFADPSSRRRVPAHRLGQGRASASRRSPPTCRSPWPSRARTSPSSTPTCGASRSRACSASSTRPS